MNTQNAMKQMHAATRKAFGQIAQTSGLPADPNVRLYKSLTQDDLQKIAAKFGPDQTMEYIRHMEAKQMMTGGKNG